MKQLFSRQIIKFATVGALNTVIDITVFTFLRLVGLDLLIANTVSTSAALLFSLIANNRYTFKERSLTPRRAAFYIGITLIGLWILQPVVIKLITYLHQYVNYTAPLANLFGHENLWITLIPKIFSVGTTVIWNYVWYNNVVFLKEKNNETTE